jgi:hypothetical protein
MYMVTIRIHKGCLVSAIQGCVTLISITSTQNPKQGIMRRSSISPYQNNWDICPSNAPCVRSPQRKNKSSEFTLTAIPQLSSQHERCIFLQIVSSVIHISGNHRVQGPGWIDSHTHFSDSFGILWSLYVEITSCVCADSMPVWVRTDLFQEFLTLILHRYTYT